MAWRIHVGGPTMNFGEMQRRLLARIRARIRNGQVTERGFARTVGISQPHINKVLKGARNLSIDRSDAILASFHLSLLDLLDESELHQHLAKLRIAAEPCVEVPIMPSIIGPGIAWNSSTAGKERHPVPCRASGSGGNVVARLAEDPEMEYSSQGWNICMLATTTTLDSATTDWLYAINRGPDTVLRKIRRGSRRLYLLTDADMDDPAKWEALRLPETLPEPILGRVVWLGREG